jgi:hypothetical protein
VRTFGAAAGPGSTGGHGHGEAGYYDDEDEELMMMQREEQAWVSNGITLHFDLVTLLLDLLPTEGGAGLGERAP